ncbi:solute carrier family 25 member 39 isoform X2 [Mauremys mutica]|uniref:solute carrier family 25 member 39 isoform X2 n=1 Tax=Mauremys mutica TaxID=74926 RepID=UPI001D15FB1F|nr:solute carrier family 25 member 39 isoform X2 [Mauremys mutica]
MFVHPEELNSRRWDCSSSMPSPTAGRAWGGAGGDASAPRPQVGSMMSENTSVSPAGGITPLQQMLASGTGALFTSLFVTPLDVVKIRLQAQRTPFSKGKCFVYCNGLMDHLYVCQNGSSCTAWYKAPTHFTGTLDAFVKITRYEGIRSLWSGLPPTLVMAVPATVIYFTTYDQLRDYLRCRMGRQGPHVPLVAGALARLGAVTVISPLELIRTKMQSRPLSYRELRVCIQSSVAQDGWLSLWRGWGPTVLRDVPFSALYWFNYELVKEWLCRQSRLDEATFMVSFTAGAVSGTVAAVLTLPFDVVKTQRQIELGDMETLRVAASKSSSTWLLLRRIRAESGTRGLFAGFLPRVIKVAPACAIMISTYEFGKTFFQKLNQERQLSSL